MSERAREDTMPRYELFCNACEEYFSKSAIGEEYEKGRVVCPNCGNDDVEERRTVFYPINHKDTA